MQLDQEAGLANFRRNGLCGRVSSGCKHPEEENSTDIFCTHYQHSHSDQEGRLPLPSYQPKEGFAISPQV